MLHTPDRQLILESLRYYQQRWANEANNDWDPGLKEIAERTVKALELEIAVLRCEHRGQDALGEVQCNSVKKNKWARYCEEHDVIVGTTVGGVVYQSC